MTHIIASYPYRFTIDTRDETFSARHRNKRVWTGYYSIDMMHAVVRFDQRRGPSEKLSVELENEITELYLREYPTRSKS